MDFKGRQKLLYFHINDTIERVGLGINLQVVSMQF